MDKTIPSPGERAREQNSKTNNKSNKNSNKQNKRQTHNDCAMFLSSENHYALKTAKISNNRQRQKCQEITKNGKN